MNNNTPKHVAMIMDGNRRWAKLHGLSELKGHAQGEKMIEPIIDEAIKLEIPYLTFWAFSTENWYRSKIEIKFLMQLFRYELDKKIDGFHKKNVKLNIIGNLEKFPDDIQRKTKEWMEITNNNKLITVNVALSYGGRDEIIRAINKWHENSKLKTQNSKLDKKILEKYLDTVDQPDPDLIIRTGGEKRLSGFLLWQSEYAELYFTDCLWPDFTPLEFVKAIKEYKKRCRRWGK